MKFKYIGNCDGMTFRGYEFPIDKAVEVKEDEVINKLKNNTCFSEVKTRQRKVVDNGDSSTDTEQGGI
jgi:hypothetical protein